VHYISVCHWCHLRYDVHWLMMNIDWWSTFSPFIDTLIHLWPSIVAIIPCYSLWWYKMEVLRLWHFVWFPLFLVSLTFIDDIVTLCIPYIVHYDIAFIIQYWCDIIIVFIYCIPLLMVTVMPVVLIFRSRIDDVDHYIDAVTCWFGIVRWYTFIWRCYCMRIPSVLLWYSIIDIIDSIVSIIIIWNVDIIDDIDDYYCIVAWSSKRCYVHCDGDERYLHWWCISFYSVLLMIIVIRYIVVTWWFIVDILMIYYVFDIFHSVVVPSMWLMMMYYCYCDIVFLLIHSVLWWLLILCDDTVTCILCIYSSDLTLPCY